MSYTFETTPRLIISATVRAGMMCWYAGPLISVNSRLLPVPIRVQSYRLSMLVFATGGFGVLAVITAWQPAGHLVRS